VENDDYAAFAHRVVAAAGRRVAAGDVEGLADLRALAGEVEAALATGVAGLRATGYSWPRSPPASAPPPGRPAALGASARRPRGNPATSTERHDTMTAPTVNGQVERSGLSVTLLPRSPAPRHDLAAELAEAEQTITDLRVEGEGLVRIGLRSREAVLARQAELDQLRRRFEEFKQTVRSTAINYAERHDWCEVVDNALEEMGLQGRNTEWTLVLTVTGTIRTTVSAATETDAIDKAREEVGLREGDSYSLHCEEFTVDGSPARPTTDRPATRPARFPLGPAAPIPTPLRKGAPRWPWTPNSCSPRPTTRRSSSTRKGSRRSPRCSP
jgi:hypothetical protein